jgi:hypothetical protein
VTTNDDSYESSGSATGTTTKDGVTSTLYYTYAQLAVPTFTLEAPIYSGSGDHTFSSTTTGGSFIRLGSSPVSVSGTSGAYAMTTAADAPAPSAFANSLLLAALVGNMSSTTTTTTTTTTVADGESDDALTIGKDGLIETSPYNGDGNYLLGFADDTRVAHATDTSGSDTDKYDLYVDGGKVSNTTKNRKAESSRLLSKGGWWDHSDGNRISTTTGDKVEVIQGNYKLVVLGRRDPSTVKDGADITDSGGGHQASKTYEYTTVDGEEIWSVRDASSAKYSYKETHGYDVSLFTGKKVVKIVGKDPDDTTVHLNKDDVIIVTMHSPDPSEDPVIISKTWAQYTESYTGTQNKYVPKTVSYSYVTDAQSYQFGTSQVKTTMLYGDNTSITAAGLNVSVSAYATADISIKTSPLACSLSMVGQTFDAKFGFNLALHTTTTGIAFQKTKVVVKEDQMAVMKDELNALKNSLIAVNTELTSQTIRLHNEVTTLSAASTSIAAADTRIAGAHSFL